MCVWSCSCCSMAWTESVAAKWSGTVQIIQRNSDQSRAYQLPLLEHCQSYSKLATCYKRITAHSFCKAEKVAHVEIEPSLQRIGSWFGSMTKRTSSIDWMSYSWCVCDCIQTGKLDHCFSSRKTKATAWSLSWEMLIRARSIPSCSKVGSAVKITQGFSTAIKT